MQVMFLGSRARVQLLDHFFTSMDMSAIYFFTKQTGSTRFCSHISLRKHYIRQPYLQQNILRNDSFLPIILEEYG